jgi:hypothetical protein
LVKRAHSRQFPLQVDAAQVGVQIAWSLLSIWMRGSIELLSGSTHLLDERAKLVVPLQSLSGRQAKVVLDLPKVHPMLVLRRKAGHVLGPECGGLRHIRIIADSAGSFASQRAPLMLSESPQGNPHPSCPSVADSS